jgi:hypothetical protein
METVSRMGGHTRGINSGGGQPYRLTHEVVGLTLAKPTLFLLLVQVLRTCTRPDRLICQP